MKVGILGTGIMGRPMARNLLEAGLEVWVWNRTREKAAPLLAAGARWADTPAALARRVDVLGLVLATPEATREVFYREDGVLDGVHPGLFVVDHGTNPLAWAQEAAPLVAEAGGQYVDAPLQGSYPEAERRELVILAGGTPAGIEPLAPYFEGVGGTVVFAGELGRGVLLKLALNLITALTGAALAEASALAAAFGLGQEVFFEALEKSSLAAPFHRGKGEKLRSGDLSPQLPLKLMNKDLRLIQAEASRVRFPLFMGGNARALYTLAERMGLGEADLIAVRNVYREEA